MNTLVTGATGFLGSHLCRALVARGHHVRALHRPTSDLAALNGVPVDPVLGDILDPPSLETAMVGIQAVFHAAAEMGPWRDPVRMSTTHVLGTRNVLTSARHAGVDRIIYLSSVAALGLPDKPGEDALLLDETHSWNAPAQLWPYGHAKYQAETEVLEAVRRGLDAVIVNPALVVGPGDLRRARSGLMWYAARGRVPVSFPGGLNAVHIQDVVEGCLAALERGQAGERYILGGENLSISRLLAITTEVAGHRPPRLVVPTRVLRACIGPAGAMARLIRLPANADILRLAGYYFYYDLRKARRDLLLSEPRTYRLAVQATLAWYQSQGYLPGR